MSGLAGRPGRPDWPSATLAVGPLSKDHVVLVAKNLHQECLLGADFLMRHGCVLDLQQNIMFTKEGPVHFVSSVSSAHSTPVCFVTLIETVTVPPNCQMCLPVERQGISQHHLLRC